MVWWLNPVIPSNWEESGEAVENDWQLSPRKGLFLCWWSSHPQILWHSLVSIYSRGFLGQQKQPVEVEGCNVLHVGRNPTMMVYSSLKTMTTAAQSEVKTGSVGLKHKRKLNLILQNVLPPLAKVWASWRPNVPDSPCWPWAAAGLHITAFYRGAGRLVEVAAGRVGYWLQITGCVPRNLRAKQSVPSSSISTLQHEAILLHSCFQCHCTGGVELTSQVLQIHSMCKYILLFWWHTFPFYQQSATRYVFIHGTFTASVKGTNSGSYCGRLNPKNLDTGQNVDVNLHINSQLVTSDEDKFNEFLYCI